MRYVIFILNTLSFMILILNKKVGYKGVAGIELK